MSFSSLYGKEARMNDHLSPEDFFEFIQGGGSGPVGHHLLSCAECLYVLDLILLAEAPATLEEEVVLDQIPKLTAVDLLTRVQLPNSNAGQLAIH